MKLRYKYLLSATSLASLLVVIVGAARFEQPRAGPITPNPVLAMLRPNAIAAGSPGFTLTVYGAFFVKKSVVQWNGEARATTEVDETLLRAQIPASDVSAEGTASVSVANPAALSEYPGVSNVLSVQILPASSR